MKPHLPLLLAGLIALPALGARAADEQALIAILESSAGAPQKWAACQELRRIGTARSVPALDALLGEEGASHTARYALEAMPCPEAGAALRDALGRTSGLVQAGLIDSLGWRRDPQSVPLLEPLLAGSDAAVAAAAAAALGRIGGARSTAALESALRRAAPAVRMAAIAGLLECAEQCLAGGNAAEASRVYTLLSAPAESDHVRAAAYAGLIRCSGQDTLARILSALEGQDPALEAAALRLAGEVQDPGATRSFAALMPRASPALQIALIALMRERGDAAALPAVLAAARAGDTAVRPAACAALGVLGDAASVPLLAESAASGGATEQKAARQALVMLHRGDVPGALVAELGRAAPAVQAEAIRALAARAERSAAPALLRLASGSQPAARQAALKALRDLADGSHIAELVRLLETARDDDAREDVIAVFESLSDRLPGGSSPNLEPIAQGLAAGDLEVRMALLRAGARFADDRLRAAFRSALADPDRRVRAAAARALCDTRDGVLLPDLIQAARGAADPGLRALAIQGILRLAAEESAELAIGQRTDALAAAFDLASSVDDKRRVLSGLARVPNLQTLELARKAAADPAVKAEAEAARLQIAQKLGFAGPFIREWLVCGPYRRPGVAGALAIFDIPFGPENPGEPVRWLAVPPADQVNLAALFPGQVDCAAYLKAELIAPEDADAILLLGSDDGVKAWLNGKLVHANNVDRGDVADQDQAPIRLAKGSNELLLKITQGAGGWSARARIVGPDGQAIAGLIQR